MTVVAFVFKLVLEEITDLMAWGQTWERFQQLETQVWQADHRWGAVGVTADVHLEHADYSMVVRLVAKLCDQCLDKVNRQVFAAHETEDARAPLTTQPCVC